MLIKKKTDLTNLLRSTKAIKINVHTKQILEITQQTSAEHPCLKQADTVQDLPQSLMTLNIQAFVLSSV